MVKPCTQLKTSKKTNKKQTKNAFNKATVKDLCNKCDTK